MHCGLAYSSRETTFSHDWLEFWRLPLTRMSRKMQHLRAEVTSVEEAALETLVIRRVSQMRSLKLTDRISPIGVSDREAGRILGVSRSTVRSNVKSGRIQAARIGRRLVIPVESLRQFLLESTVPQK